MSIREELANFGLKLPDDIPVDEWASKLTEKPMQNTLTLVGLSTLAFYVAERGRNPKVNDIWDSMIYCTTNLSVGYSDIFAKTMLGKIVGSVLMTIGPAMAARALDGPATERREAAQEEILLTLQKILDRLTTPAPVPASPSQSDPAAATGDTAPPAHTPTNKEE